MSKNIKVDKKLNNQTIKSPSKNENLNNELYTLSTAQSTKSSENLFKNYKKQRTDSYGVLIQKDVKKHKVNISTDISVVEVENYKEYNVKTPSNIFFEAMSDLSNTCSCCNIW